jgi:hypothetical protein
MDLLLRRGIHSQAHNNYRVILKDDGLEVEIGSIGIRHGNGATEAWVWAIDTVIPMQEVDAQGLGKDRKDCLKRFRAAWDQFSADPARLTSSSVRSRAGLGERPEAR